MEGIYARPGRSESELTSPARLRESRILPSFIALGLETSEPSDGSRGGTRSQESNGAAVKGPDEHVDEPWGVEFTT